MYMFIDMYIHIYSYMYMFMLYLHNFMWSHAKLTRANMLKAFKVKY